MRMTVLAGAALVMVLAIMPAPTLAADRQASREGSLYLQCDGKPNNTTLGIGIVSIFGFENTMSMLGYEDEEPSDHPRLFGAEGVEACSQLIDGERAEGNRLRRIELILARALHRMEMGDPDAAEADLALARQEAEAAGYGDDPYFENSLGQSFAVIGAIIELRRGNLEEAQHRMMAFANARPFTLHTLMAMNDMIDFAGNLPPEAEERMEHLSRLMPQALYLHAVRLQEAGRYAEAADKIESMVALGEVYLPQGGDPETLAHAATAHALAGNWNLARARAQAAREAMARQAEAEDYAGPAKVTGDTLAVFDILQLLENGEAEAARAMFIARADEWRPWRNPALLAALERLREGAAPEALEDGPLSVVPELWLARARMVTLRETLSSDAMFRMIVPYADPDEYEDRSRSTYRLDRSSIMEPLDWGEDLWFLIAFDHPPSAADSILLHSALQARERGFEGFQIYVRLPEEEGKYAATSALMRFANRGDEGVEDALFLPAEAVIAELGELIPPPGEIRQRRRDRRSR